jgi:hypothetical protein
MHRIRFVLMLAVAAVLLAAPFARGATSTVVVSQVFAGGGNAGAPFTNDFVELVNRGSAPVDVSGWTVQYASAAATTWQSTALSGSIQPGRYYLVQLASTAAVGAPLPAPDATGTTNLAASGGKVALVRGGTNLICGATAGSCASDTSIEDFVGYGSASDYEGTGPAPALSATTADFRSAAGCSDTNANATDFATAQPLPRDSSSAAAACAATPISNATADAGVDVDVAPVISITLEHSSLSFGNVPAGETPASLSERVTVVSNNATGYALTVHRSAFAPADLPLAIASSATAPLVAIPIPPTADLLLATSSAPSPVSGDVWPTRVGFASTLPSVSPGMYTATLTFTVIGR